MPRSKTIQSGRPVRSWEQPFRVADLFQTYLPMLVLIVIMALFIYNLGYFYGLDWRYMSLLRTRDYYSGTLPGACSGADFIHFSDSTDFRQFFRAVSETAA